MDTLRDSLTGVFTRAVFHERLAEEVERARRYSHPLSLLVLDIDYFKSINDAFGHVRGDEVLSSFVVIVEKALRRADLLFRYGGDEFVVVLPFTGQNEAAVVAQRLLEAVASAPMPGEPPLKVSVSIGLAELTDGLSTPEDLFVRADQCAYAAKLAGRGGIASGPAETGGKLAFDAVSRLIERDEALDQLHNFISRIPSTQRGTMGILGMPGSGRSRFLADVSKIVRLHGYAVWVVRTHPGLRFRAFGALSDSQPPWSDLPSPSMGASVLVNTIQTRLTEHQQLGLILLVEDLADLDRSGLVLLQSLLATAEPINLAVIYSELPGASAVLEAPMQEMVRLTPLSMQGTRLWLRSVLQWEAPEEFCLWLHEISAGFPGRLETILTELVRQAYLIPQAKGWELNNKYINFSPDDRIEQPDKQLTGLPVSELEFVGRETDLQSVKNLIHEHRLVTVVAPGGMGKTRLAMQIGWEVLDRFADGVFWVDLTSVTSGDFIFPAIAVACNLQLNGLEPPDIQVIQHLRGKKALLIFDNFEQLPDGAAVLYSLEQFAPQVKLLITSRERLNLPGEQVYDLMGLPIPQELEGSSLHQLFQQSLNRVPGGEALAEADKPYVRRIGELVAGMPLGIELAAAWAPSLGCQGVVEEIEHNLDILTSSRQNVPERQRGLRAVFDTFWHSLMNDEQEALSRLAVFRGSFLRSAAQHVAGIKSFFFAALVDRFYITQREGGRFSIHELLRQYIEEKLRGFPGIYDESCQAHAGYYLSIVEQSTVEYARQQFWLKRLQDEHDNLRAALHWSLVNKPEIGLKLASNLRFFWRLRGYFHEGRRWIEAALSASQGEADQIHPDDLHTQARAWTTAGILHELLGDYLLAQERFRSGLEFARLSGDDGLIAEALIELGWLVHHHGANDDAQQIAEEALNKARLAQQDLLVARALCLVSSIRGFFGEYEAAIAYALESLTLARQLGTQNDAARALNLLGLMSSNQGELDQAARYLEEALAIASYLEQTQFIAIVSLNLGNVEYRRGNLAHAEDAIQRAVELFHSISERMYSAYAECRLGIVCVSQNRMESAQKYLMEGLQHARAAGLEPHVLYALSGLAQWYTRMDNMEFAAELLGFIENHPKATIAKNEVADSLFADLKDRMPASHLESAMGRGKELTLEEVIRKFSIH